MATLGDGYMFDKECGLILKALYESPKGLGFRDLMDATSIAQRPLRRRLNELRREKYILVANRPRKGQKEMHILTKKGEVKALNFMKTEEIFDNIMKSKIKLKDEIVDMLSKMPLDMWIESAQAKKLISERSFLVPYILAVIIRDFHELLFEILFSKHPELKKLNYYVGAIPKKGIHLIPEAFIKEKGLC